MGLLLGLAPCSGGGGDDTPIDPPGVAQVPPPSTQSNSAPIIETPTIFGLENVALSATISASDADGDAISFSLIESPDWLSVNASGAASGTPGSADAGSSTISIVLAWIIQKFQWTASLNGPPRSARAKRLQASQLALRRIICASIMTIPARSARTRRPHRSRRYRHCQTLSKASLSAFEKTLGRWSAACLREVAGDTCSVSARHTFSVRVKCVKTWRTSPISSQLASEGN